MKDSPHTNKDSEISKGSTAAHKEPEFGKRKAQTVWVGVVLSLFTLSLSQLWGSLGGDLASVASSESNLSWEER
jgi:hypothetical protein